MEMLIVAGVLSIILTIASIGHDIASGTDVFVSAKTYFLGGFFIFIIVGLIKNVAVYDSPVSVQNDVQFIGGFLTLLAISSFLIGYGKSVGGRRWATGSEQSAQTLPVSVDFLYIFTVGIFILGAVGIVLYNPVLNAEAGIEYTGFIRAFVYFNVISGILCVYCLDNLRYSRSSFRRFIFLSLCVMLAVCVFSLVTRTSRYVYLYLIAFIPIYFYCTRWYLRGRRYSFGLLGGIFMVVVLIFIIGNITKTVVLMFQDQGEIVVQWGDLFYSTVQRIVSLDFIDAFDNLLYIIEVLYLNDRFLYGETLVAPFVNFVPREFWAGKPLAFGTIVAEEIYGSHVEFNLAPSLVGELLANFGFAGVAIGYATFGMLAKRVDRAITKLGNKHWQLVYLIPILYLFGMQNRGDFLLNIELLYVIFPLFLTVSTALRLSSVQLSRG
jgi:hypothetical protein